MSKSKSHFRDSLKSSNQRGLFDEPARSKLVVRKAQAAAPPPAPAPVAKSPIKLTTPKEMVASLQAREPYQGSRSAAAPAASRGIDLSAPIRRTALAVGVEQLDQVVTGLLNDYEALVKGVGTAQGSVCPQDALVAAKRLDDIRSRISKFYDKQIEAWFMELRRAGGTFAPGRAVVEFKTSDKSSPKWKEIAVALKEELCKRNQEAFNADLFCEQVKNEAPKSGKISVNIVLLDDSQVA